MLIEANTNTTILLKKMEHRSSHLLDKLVDIWIFSATDILNSALGMIHRKSVIYFGQHLFYRSVVMAISY